MKDIQKSALNKAINILNAINAKYLVIDSDGETHKNHQFNIVEKPQKIVRAESVFPRGEVKNHFLPLVKNMVAGDVAVIDAGKYGAERVRGSICSWFSQMHGNGTATTSINSRNNTVEVLRIK
jgi:hypothetical protein